MTRFRLPPGLPATPPGVRVRLPELPPQLRPVDRPAPPAPPPQAPPALGVGASYEAVTVDVPWPRAKEASVYTTTRRWRACDVFVTFTPNAPGTVDFILSAFVYAVSAGSRILVASGRLVDNGQNPSSGQAWIAAARTVAERYEVTIRYDGSTLGPNLPGNVAVTVAASDEMTAPPPGIGQITELGSPTGAKFTFVQRTFPPFLEVVGVTGVNTAAAARYLQLFDDTSTSFAGVTTAPRMVWPLGNVAGEGVVASPAYRCVRSPILVVSTAAGASTPAADGAATLVVR